MSPQGELPIAPYFLPSQSPPNKRRPHSRPGSAQPKKKKAAESLKLSCTRKPFTLKKKQTVSVFYAAKRK
jgi:hypothetical protein